MCVRAARSCLHEVPISRAGVFVGIELGRGQRLCTHGDDAPVPIPNIMNLQQRKVAANAHILCRVRHVDCLAGVTLESLLRYVL